MPKRTITYEKDEPSNLESYSDFSQNNSSNFLLVINERDKFQKGPYSFMKYDFFRCLQIDPNSP